MIRLLNQAILMMAPAFDARPIAPGSLADLRQCDPRRLVVWDGASDATIYGDARVNHAFRAWHDLHHWRYGFTFDLAGEIAACASQCAELRDAFPCVPQAALDLIHREIVGQAEYFAAHGMFPADQGAFHAS